MGENYSGLKQVKKQPLRWHDKKNFFYSFIQAERSRGSQLFWFITVVIHGSFMQCAIGK